MARPLTVPGQIVVMAALVVALVAGSIAFFDWLDDRPASVPAAVMAFFNQLDGGR